MPIDLRQLARYGAAMRLQEINREIAAIKAAFPTLRGGRSAPAPGKRRRRMSAAGRAAISRAAKKMWAARRRKKG
jgi:hypothetical protein